MYRTIPGAFESSTEVDSESFVTVPRAVNKLISEKLAMPTNSSFSFPVEYPLDSIPEDADAEAPPPIELP